MKNVERKRLLLINTIYILLLAAVLFPLFAISKYNYPSADDWSYGVNVHSALKAGEGVVGAIKAVATVVSSSYRDWEGRFSNALLASIQPGVFGEQYYGIVAYFILGTLILSEIILVYVILSKIKREKEKLLVLPVCIPILVLQILYCPYPEESFYWYTGAVNYTFMYSLSLVLLAVVICMGQGELSKGKYIALMIISCIFGILIGGNNFATSLSTLCTLIIIDILCFIFKRPMFKRIWFVTIPLMASFLACILSPGLQKRLNGNFEGEVLYSPLKAVGMSFIRSFYNILGWTDLKVLFVILLILPFIWKAVKGSSYLFPWPILFTLLTFGLYASQITATLYVDGTTGGGRQGAILWYSYLLWIVGNIGYWTGWICRKTTIRMSVNVKKEEMKESGHSGEKVIVSRQTKKEKMRNELAEKMTGKYLLVYCAVCGAALLGFIYLSGIGKTTSYKAYRLWRNGWARQYGEAWEARLKILNDDSIKQVEFQPLQPIELLMYTDLQPEKGYIWVNSACASYYDKEYIHIVTKGTD